jgi:hypothetical protein
MAARQTTPAATYSPRPEGPSTIGAEGLNCSVRNGKRCFPLAIATGTCRDHPSRRTLKTALQPPVNGDQKKPSSPRTISTGLLHALPRVQIRPINLVVYQGPYSLKGDGRIHLEAGFPLRCLQRLSDPFVAKLRCPWQDNSYTRGTFTPVLSY